MTAVRDLWAVTALLTAPFSGVSARSLTTEHAELIRAVVLAKMLARLEGPDLGTDLAWLDAYLRLLEPSGPEPGARPDPAETELAWTLRLDEFEQNLGEDRTPWQRLDRDESLLVCATGLIEDDLRFGSLFAALQAPLPARRPCVGLLSWLLTDSADERALGQRAAELAYRGVLRITNPDEPRAEWVLRLPAPVADLLRTGRIDPVGLPAELTLCPAAGFPPLALVWVDDDAMEPVRRLPALLAAGTASAVVVRGLGRSGRRTVLGAAAASLGRDLLVLDQTATPPECWRTFAALAGLGRVLPVLRCQPSPEEPLQLPTLPGYAGTVGVLAPPAGGLTGPLLERPATVELGLCDAESRRQLWQRSGLDPIRDELDAITTTFLLTPGNLVAAARIARDATDICVCATDVRDAVRTLHRQQLEPLASRLEPLLAPEPVLDQLAAEEFDSLLLRCRHRELLAAAQASAGRGVRALFSGPSGTGKTLTARYLAGCLSLDVYRVNLAGVVNKYLGVTERNLDTVFSVAEELGVVLLLDEGDALMTRRTDVSDANDRYANLETNFLLQRLEAYTGIVVITSNAASRIDQAFQRRIDVTVDFAPPSPEQRWQIWQAHLPAGHAVGDPLLTDLARRCPLTGGSIRNVAVHATLLALDARCPVDDAIVLAALRREYRRGGGTCPL